jgi:uncharacterized protein YdhG (YjbR/CyaY superfamily)
MTAVQKGSKSSKSTAAGKKGFTEEERAAMKDRIKELRAEKEEAEGESAVLAKIAGMSEPDRSLGKRLHAIIRASAPNLVPRLWYGMPAYSKEGNIVCHFQPAEKFKLRYMTLGFSDEANLDEGSMWPVAFALKALTAAEEARIASLVKKAVS